MKAFTLARYGGPEVLELSDVPDPKAGPGEVLVRIEATTINDWDWGYMRGLPWIYRLMTGLTRPSQPILGTELAGVVEAVGEGATRFAVGDAVYGDVSEAGFGGFAELAAVKEEALRRVPAGLSMNEAVAIPHAAGLAAQGLKMAGLKAGERLLVNGAGGGVGAFAVQLARRLGVASVTGVDAAEKRPTMKQLGYDEALDYREVDFVAAGQWDVVLDAKTTRWPWRHLEALGAGGRYVTVGGYLPQLLAHLLWGMPARWVTGKRLQILPLKPNMGLEMVEKLAAGGRLDVPIDGPFPWEELPAAMARFGAAKHVGKVVIEVGEVDG